MAINNARTYFDDEEHGEELSQENIDRTLREVDEIEGKEGRYDEMTARSIADAEADTQAAAAATGARQVSPEEQKESEAKQAPQAAATPAEPAQNLTPLSDAERKAIAEGPHNVMAVGSGGLIRNKTTPDVAKRAEEKAQMRVAMRAAKDAEAAKRQELLASGMYYDDGRGNIKLRKDYMEKRRRANGRGVTEIYNDQSWQTALDIQNAGKEAYDRAMGIVEETPAAKSAAKTRAAVDANRAALTAEELERKQRKMNTAKGHLAIFDGLAAAYDALRQNNPEEAEEETKLVFNKTDAQGRDGRWKYDEQGRIVGQADAVRVKTGKRFMNGYVAPDVIRSINDNLAQRGNDKYRITGILARQGVDAIGVARGEPIFYVQGKRADGSAFMKTMTMKDAYRFGVESGTESGIFAEYAEQNVIDALGDVFGVDRRKNAPTEKERIVAAEMSGKERMAAAENESREKIAQIQHGTPEQQRAKMLLDEEKILRQSLYDKDGVPIEMSDEERAETMAQMRVIRRARLEALGIKLDDGSDRNAVSEAPAAQSPVVSREQVAAGIEAKQVQALREKANKRQAAAPVVTEKPTNPAPTKPEEVKQPKQRLDSEEDRRSRNGGRAMNRQELISRFKTVQDVAEDTVQSLIKNGELGKLANVGGTRRNLSPQEKDLIINSVHQRFIDAGMNDFWEREVEEYTRENRGSYLSKDAIIDKLFKNWNNKTAPIKFGNLHSDKAKTL